jgi:hypothetical protein
MVKCLAQGHLETVQALGCGEIWTQEFLATGSITHPGWDAGPLQVSSQLRLVPIYTPVLREACRARCLAQGLLETVSALARFLPRNFPGYESSNWEHQSPEWDAGPSQVSFPVKTITYLCGCLGKPVWSCCASFEWSISWPLTSLWSKISQILQLFFIFICNYTKNYSYKKWPDHRHSTCCILGLNRDIIII